MNYKILNKISLNGFGEIELYILFWIIESIKNNKSENKFTIFSLMLPELLQQKLEDEILKGIREKFLKLNIVELEETNDFLEKISFSLFHEFKLFYSKEDNALIKIEIKINSRLKEFLVQFTDNFTSSEIVDILRINGKYAKLLKIMLSPYEECHKIALDDFIKVMDIPKAYKMCDIDKKVILPAIIELKNTGIFSFLVFKKIKGAGRGRGGKVVGIEFKFKHNKQQIEDVREILERFIGFYLSDSFNNAYKVVGFIEMEDKYGIKVIKNMTESGTIWCKNIWEVLERLCDGKL